jgi:hypothetical protein
MDLDREDNPEPAGRQRWGEWSRENSVLDRAVRI